MRRIFWSKRDEVTGVWRKLHNEQLHDLSVILTHYCAGDKIDKCILESVQYCAGG
jgi:hypothetical protein